MRRGIMLMRKTLPLSIAVCIMLVAGLAVAVETREQPSPFLAQLQAGTRELVERIVPTAVTVVLPNYAGNGSGIIIDADGHIVTNYHVVGAFKDKPFTKLMKNIGVLIPNVQEVQVKLRQNKLLHHQKMFHMKQNQIIFGILHMLKHQKLLMKHTLIKNQLTSLNAKNKN